MYCAEMPRMITATRFIAGLAVAIMALALIETPSTVATDGTVPPASRLYTVLSRKRLPVPEAPELLLIQAKNPVAQAALGSFELADCVLTLKEMEVDKILSLLPMTQPSGTSILTSERRKNLEARFEKEFSLIDKNIGTLFEAIRLGAIRTKDSARFVQELQALVQQSRMRLLSETIEGDTSGQLLLAQARATFSTGHYADNLSSLGLVLPEYSDAYAVMELPVSAEGTMPFRRIDFQEIAKYSAQDKALYGLLADMEHAGYLASLDPGSHPPALYDHALSLKKIFLAKPSDESELSWRKAREDYLGSIRTLLSSQTETELLNGFDLLLAAESLEDTGTTRINDLKQSVSATFTSARLSFNEFQHARDRLQKALRGSLCIMGSASDPTQAETMAFLANSILTDSHFRVATGSRYKLWTLLPALVAAALLAPFGTLLSALLGLFSIVASAGVFSLLFVYQGIWMDPLAVAVLTASAVAASLAVELAVRVRITARLRQRAGNRLPQTAITALAGRHILPPDTDQSARAAIVAVRHFGESSLVDNEDSGSQAAALRAFHDAAAAELTKRGGVILGVDEFILIAGFGTPLHTAADNSANGSTKDPSDEAGRDLSQAAQQACDAALDITVSAPELSGEWRFGLDLGVCNFFYSRVDGYSAVGRAINYARLLSGLSSKYNTRILVTQGIVSEAGDRFKTRRLDSLVEKASGNEHAFYELISMPKP